MSLGCRQHVPQLRRAGRLASLLIHCSAPEANQEGSLNSPAWRACPFAIRMLFPVPSIVMRGWVFHSPHRYLAPSRCHRWLPLHLRGHPGHGGVQLGARASVHSLGTGWPFPGALHSKPTFPRAVATAPRPTQSVLHPVLSFTFLLRPRPKSRCSEWPGGRKAWTAWSDTCSLPRRRKESGPQKACRPQRSPPLSLGQLAECFSFR